MRRQTAAAALSRLVAVGVVALALSLAVASAADEPAAAANATAAPALTYVDLRMPADYVTTQTDEYACTTIELPSAPHKVVAVEPLAEQGTVHHILLFGCRTPHVAPTPSDPRPVWACRHVRACAGDSEAIFYGWGKNAPALRLPEGVGYSVGARGSDIRYVVAQVHYLQPKPKGDVSGVRLTLSPAPAPFSGGMLSYASMFKIPPGRKSFLIPNACCYRGFQPLKTFAVRVHTHALGRGVSLVRHPPLPAGDPQAALSARASGRASPETIAAGDPQAPQGFNASPPKLLVPGDPLTTTCDFDSSSAKREVQAGATHGDEMCNLYLMLYSPLPHLEMCADGAALVDDRSPGNLPPGRSGARFLADPYPRWRPPALPGANPAPISGGDLGAAAAAAANGQLGDVASVAVGPDGTLWALHRGSRRWGAGSFDAQNRATDMTPIAENVVLALDPDTGAVKKRWGGGLFVMPHMITADLRDGSLWVTDVGRHQALKFSPEGQLLAELGEKGEPGRGEKRLCKPTQVRPLRDGGVVVSDGYCNSRAVRFDAGGKYVQEYGLGEGWESRQRPGMSKGALAAAAAAPKPAEGGFSIFAGDGESVGAELAEARRLAAFEATRRQNAFSASPPARGYNDMAAAKQGLNSNNNNKQQKGPEPMFVVHSALVDECEGVVRLADREGRRVLAFDLKTGAFLGSVQTKWPVWALIAGPYGRSLALIYDPAARADAELVDADRPDSAAWPLSGTADKWPHDVALGAAPLALTGAGERLFALWSAPLCPDRPCGPIMKHVLFPRGFGGAQGGVGDEMAAEQAAEAGQEGGGSGGGGGGAADDDDGESALLSYGSVQRPKEVAAHLVVRGQKGNRQRSGDGAGDADATEEEKGALREGLRVVAEELDAQALAGPDAREDFRVVRGGAGALGAAGAGGSAGRLALIVAALAAVLVVAAAQVWGGGGGGGRSGGRRGGGGGGLNGAADDGFTVARYPPSRAQPHVPLRTDDPDAAPLFGGPGAGSSSAGGARGGAGAGKPALPPSDRRGGDF